MLHSGVKANGGVRALLTGALAAAFLLACASAPVRAADDEDESFDQKLMRQFMEGIGLRQDGSGINYQERSPLVVPPSRSLPVPDAGSAAETNPAWPVDADVKRRKAEKAAAAKKQYYTSQKFDDDARPIKPDELRKGGLPRSQQTRTTNTTAEESGRPMKPSALGYTGGIFNSLFGGKSDEVATFTNEPPRANLTDPPPGYQTPSPNQPYGFKNKQVFQPYDIKNKGTDTFGN